MKTIKIAHLYYDLLNLNGENGNVLALKKHFENQNIKVEVHFLTIDDEIDFTRYDIYYIGTGIKDNQLLAINDLLKYKNEIKKSINNNKYFIVTGNAIELFGKCLEDIDGVKHECLDIFPYTAKEADFQIVGEQIYKTKSIDKNIIGFQNRYSILNNDENYLFEVVKGTGYKPKSEYEGFNYKNFYGTYLLGPFLIRNPYFTDYLVKKILTENKIKFIDNSNSYEYDAYREYEKNFINN